MDTSILMMLERASKNYSDKVEMAVRVLLLESCKSVQRLSAHG